MMNKKHWKVVLLLAALVGATAPAQLAGDDCNKDCSYASAQCLDRAIGERRQGTKRGE